MHEYYNDIILPVDRELNEKEQEFREKFIFQLDEYNYIPRPDERFAQCLSYIDKYRYYNAYWFESNYAYLYSAYFKDLHQNRPSLKIGGYKSARETYDKFPEYVRNICPETWEKNAINGYRPKYYFFTNTYPGSHDLSNKKSMLVKQANLVACYFDPHPELLESKTGELHHTWFMDFSKPPQESNRWDRIQLVDNKHNPAGSLRNPINQHSYIHTISHNLDDPNKVTIVDTQLINGIVHFYAKSALVEDAPIVDITRLPNGKIESLRLC